MNKSLFFTALAIFLAAGSALAQHWAKQREWPNDSYAVSRIDFANINNGFLAYSGLYHQAYVTTDGGDSWQIPAQLPNFAPHTPTAVLFGDSSIGMAVEEWFQDSAIFYVSHNVGTTWQPIVVPEFSGTIQTLAFASDSTWYAGHPGWLFKTEDAGQTWTEVYEANHLIVGYLPQVFGDTLYMSILRGTTWSAADTSALLRTFDGGTTWDQVLLPASHNFPIKEINFVSHDVGFARSDTSILRTTDAGTTWTSLDFGLGDYPSYRALAMQSATEGFFAADQRVFRVQNGSATEEAEFGQVQTLTFAGNNLFAGSWQEVWYRRPWPVSAPELPEPESVEVFPNPNNGQFTVRSACNQELPITLELYNQLGQLKWRSNNAAACNWQIDLSDQAPGLYLLRAKMSDGMMTKRIVVQ